MGKFLILLIGLGGACYLAWGKYFKPQVVSVQERMADVVDSGASTADELANLAKQDAQLVGKALKGRMISVSGSLAHAIVKGVPSADLILELQGDAKRRIVFQSDFEKFTRMLEGVKNGEFKFQKFGNEIVMIPLVKKSANLSASPDGQRVQIKEAEPEVILREGDRITLKGMFEHVGDHRISFQLRELPRR